MPLSIELDRKEVRKTVLNYALLIVGVVLIGVVFHLMTKKDNQVTHHYDEYTYPESYFVEVEGNYVDYQKNYECGAYSSAYILRNFKEEADGLSLYETYPGKVHDGISPMGIQTFFRNRGYNIEYLEDRSVEDLKQDLYLSKNVIAFIRVEANEPYTHYVPIVGYDKEYFYFAESLPYKANSKDDGEFYNRKTSIKEFEKLWQNIDGMWTRPYFVIEKPE